MKKRWLMAWAALVLSTTAAQANNGWGLYGAYLEKGEAFGPGFKLTVEMVPALQLDFHAAHFNEVTAGGLELKVTPLEIGLAMNVPLTESLKLSLGGGPSYSFVENGEADDEIGGYIGGCLEFAPYPDVALFLEARCVFLDVGPEDLNGLGLNAGLMVTW